MTKLYILSITSHNIPIHSPPITRRKNPRNVPFSGSTSSVPLWSSWFFVSFFFFPLLANTFCMSHISIKVLWWLSLWNLDVDSTSLRMISAFSQSLAEVSLMITGISLLIVPVIYHQNLRYFSCLWKFSIAATVSQRT